MTDDRKRFSHVRLAPVDGAADPAERYVPGPVVDRGALGVIRRARDAVLGRDVALKVLGEEHDAASPFANRFVEEARRVGRLQHPGVVPVYDMGADPTGRPFFVMRLLDAEPLSDRLARPSPSGADQRWFLRVFVKVCQTAAYAHARGVAHGSLATENVMIGAFGEVQVAGWDAASEFEHRGESPPEPERADVRALGGILEAILTRVSPAPEALVRLRRRCFEPGAGAPSLTARNLADAVSSHLAAAEERAHRALIRVARDRAEADDQRRARGHAIVLFVAAIVLLGAVAVALTLLERQRGIRARMAADAVDRAIDLATVRHAGGDDLAAEGAAARAVELSRDRYPRRLQRARALLAEIRDAREAARLRDRRSRRDAKLLARLETIRARGHGDPRLADAKYEAAFRAAGIDVDGAARSAVEELRGSSVAEPLAAAISAWEDVRRSMPARDAQSLARLADSVDPDARRAAVRAALRATDPAELAELTGPENLDRVSGALAGLVGRALVRTDGPAGVAFLRRAQRRYPDDPWTNHELAFALSERAVPSWRDVLRFAQAAVALRPDNPVFRTRLGIAELRCGDLGSARLTSSEVVSRFPGFAQGRALRGWIRLEVGDLDGARESCSEALKIEDAAPELHHQLASVLGRMGRFDEALAAAIRAREVALEHPGTGDPATYRRVVATYERLVHLATMLPDILAGRIKPLDLDEGIAFARLCYATGHYAAAARFFDHIQGTIQRRNPSITHARFEGTIESAVLAGCGQGRDAGDLDEADRALWRERALSWMRAGRRAHRTPQAALRELRQWMERPCYAEVRDPARRAGLPEEEREAWRVFWLSVERRIRQLGGW